MNSLRYHFFVGWLVCLPLAVPASGASLGDCLWGGSNEETAYTNTFVPGMGGVSLAQAAPPAMNLGAPPPAIPVQAGAGNINNYPNAQYIPQANVPMLTVPTGAVGAVGRSATLPVAGGVNPQGREIVYVLPNGEKSEELCINGKPGIPATAVQVVPAGTPGAIPAAIRTVSVVCPKTEYHWSYSPIREQTNTLVKVVDPRTGRVVKTYCKDNEEKSLLPWIHRKEIVSYETVTVRVAEPVALNPVASQAVQQIAPTATPSAGVFDSLNRTAETYRSNYPNVVPSEGNAMPTVIIP